MTNGQGDRSSSAGGPSREVHARAQARREADETLVAGARSGDRSAHGRLFDHWADVVYDRAVHAGVPAGDLSQVLTTSFRGAFSELERSQEPFGVIVLRASLVDTSRRSKAPRAPALGAESRLARATNASTVAADADVAALVWEAASVLGPRSREVLDLVWRQGLEPDEVAGVLGMSRAEVAATVAKLPRALDVATRARVLYRGGSPELPEVAEAIERAGSGFDGPTVVALNEAIKDNERARALSMVALAPIEVFSAIPHAAAPTQLRKDVAAAVRPRGGAGAAAAAAAAVPAAAAAGEPEPTPEPTPEPEATPEPTAEAEPIDDVAGDEDDRSAGPGAAVAGAAVAGAAVAGAAAAGADDLSPGDADDGAGDAAEPDAHDGAGDQAPSDDAPGTDDGADAPTEAVPATAGAATAGAAAGTSGLAGLDDLRETTTIDEDAADEHGGRNRTPMLIGGGVVAVLIVVGLLLMLGGGDEEPVATGPSTTGGRVATTTTTEATTTTRRPTTTTTEATTTTDPEGTTTTLPPDTTIAPIGGGGDGGGGGGGDTGGGGGGPVPPPPPPPPPTPPPTLPTQATTSIGLFPERNINSGTSSQVSLSWSSTCTGPCSVSVSGPNVSSIQPSGTQTVCPAPAGSTCRSTRTYRIEVRNAGGGIISVNQVTLTYNG